MPRITSDSGTIDALDKRQAVSGFVGMTVQTFTGTSVALKCQTEGSPKPVVSWSKNGEPLESKGRVSISSDGTLTIKSTRAQDTGRYKCSAKNAIGETSEASSVYIRSEYSIAIYDLRYIGGHYFGGKCSDPLINWSISFACLMKIQQN